MTITDEQPTDAAAPADRWARRGRAAGWILAVGWLALLMSLVAFGTRESSYDQLRSGIRSGAITEVQESSTDFEPGMSDFETVTLRWREGLISRTATLIHASGERAAKDARRDGQSDPVVVGSVADHLTALNPDLRVRTGERTYPAYTLSGWEGPGWIGLAYLVLLLGTLVLIRGTRTWRATRAAWAWLVLLAPPFGVPAYFLFGGPLGLFRPRPPIRVGLTGGWAFLLALLLGGAGSS